MAVFTSTEWKRYGPEQAAQNCDQVAVVKGLLKADNWATLQSKIIASASISSADWNFAASGDDLQVTINGKSNVDPSDTSALADDIALAYIDTVNQIAYLITDLTDRDITNDAGDLINIPANIVYIREMTTV